ncbi:MAG: purine-nucleoside phosphorylase [Helicobacteraceae bacterium]|jgi:nucleoside phosphorylase|nr:purine-nucleoside phosphorylase [Helicobacteraceae bacterium]
MIVCAGKSETFDFAMPIGVGLIESAIRLTEFCLQLRPKTLIFVGSAGSYGGFKPFDIATSQGAANIEVGFLKKMCYTPIENVILSNTGLFDHHCVVNSSNYITTDASVSDYMLKRSIGLENMEFFSVMRVAEEFGVPAGGVFCVTNFCNENAHSDFTANHDRARALLKKHVEQNVIGKFES